MSRPTQTTLFDPFDNTIFPISSAVLEAIETLATHGDAEVRGAVFTRIEVVEFILDLVGYTQNKPLHRQRILEPSFGGGEFLLAMIDRLVFSWQNTGGQLRNVVCDLGDAIKAVELHRETFETTHLTIINRLVESGIDHPSAESLANKWLVQGDFLLESLPGQFDYVVGNPPYVRQEMVPAQLLAEYRRRYRTIYDRADLYIPFIERSLLLLGNGGNLGFICADRWMKNRYGGPLRELIAQDFHLKVYVDMVGSAAFHSEVSAYPAITVICRDNPGNTRIAHRPKVDKKNLESLAGQMCAKVLAKDDSVKEIPNVVKGAEPWLFDSSDQLALIRRLEKQYPELEQTGCKVGIGVATGADKAFIGDFATLDVESERKLPLVTTQDIKSGEVVWRGQGVINPFAEDCGLVDLDDFPRLARYLEERKEVIAKRHCAQKTPANWYRTIDRIWPALARTPKLLIPDIKGEAHIVFEDGVLYPHHNLYYVTSGTWDLHALQAVLLSGIAKLFVATYSTRMRGGYLRFQAQYLRRIRIPFWQDVADDLRLELMAAAKNRDLDACNRAACKLYNLNSAEKAILGG